MKILYFITWQSELVILLIETLLIWQYHNNYLFMLKHFLFYPQLLAWVLELLSILLAGMPRKWRPPVEQMQPGTSWAPAVFGGPSFWLSSVVWTPSFWLRWPSSWPPDTCACSRSLHMPTTAPFTKVCESILVNLMKAIQGGQGICCWQFTHLVSSKCWTFTKLIYFPGYNL